MSSDKSSPPVNTSHKVRPQRLLRATVLVAAIALVFLGGIVAYEIHHKTANPTKSAEIPESGKQTESELGDYKQQVTITITDKDQHQRRSISQPILVSSG